MKELKTTPWFPASVKPERIGMYERDYEIYRNYGVDERRRNSLDYWNGENWQMGCKGEITGHRLLCNRAWRGLASDPNA